MKSFVEKLNVLSSLNDRGVSSEALKLKMEIMKDCDFLFARKCSVTGLGMNAGFVVNDGLYFKEQNDAMTHLVSIGFIGMNDAYESGACYYTEWDDFDDMQYILMDGMLMEFDGGSVPLS